MKNFQDARTHHYELSGQVLALTAGSLGTPIPAPTTDMWIHTMSRLAVADDLSEASPGQLDAHGLLSILELRPNTMLLHSADGLLAANQDALRAKTVSDYFNARTREGIRTTDLFRYQSPYHIKSNNRLWQQLAVLAVAGVHFDTLLDCKEDAKQLEQFTSAQLAVGAAVNLAKASRHLKRETATALVRSCHYLGIDSKILKLVPKALLTSA